MKYLTTVIAKADLGSLGVKPSGDLVAAILETNGSAWKFTYSPEDVVRIARDAEKRLDLTHLPQAERVGFEVHARARGPRARAYKFPASGSEVWLRRSVKGWMLAQVKRCPVYPGQDERVRYSAPAGMRAEISRRAVLDIDEIKQPTPPIELSGRSLQIVESGYAA